MSSKQMTLRIVGLVFIYAIIVSALFLSTPMINKTGQTPRVFYLKTFPSISPPTTSIPRGGVVKGLSLEDLAGKITASRERSNASMIYKYFFGGRIIELKLVQILKSGTLPVYTHPWNLWFYAYRGGKWILLPARIYDHRYILRNMTVYHVPDNLSPNHTLLLTLPTIIPMKEKLSGLLSIHPKALMIIMVKVKLVTGSYSFTFPIEIVVDPAMNNPFIMKNTLYQNILDIHDTWIDKPLLGALTDKKLTSQIVHEYNASITTLYWSIIKAYRKPIKSVEITNTSVVWVGAKPVGTGELTPDVIEAVPTSRIVFDNWNYTIYGNHELPIALKPLFSTGLDLSRIRLIDQYINIKLTPEEKKPVTRRLLVEYRGVSHIYTVSALTINRLLLHVWINQSGAGLLNTSILRIKILDAPPSEKWVITVSYTSRYNTSGIIPGSPLNKELVLNTAHDKEWLHISLNPSETMSCLYYITDLPETSYIAPNGSVILRDYTIRIDLKQGLASTGPGRIKAVVMVGDNYAEKILGIGNNTLSLGKIKLNNYLYLQEPVPIIIRLEPAGKNGIDAWVRISLGKSNYKLLVRPIQPVYMGGNVIYTSIYRDGWKSISSGLEYSEKYYITSIISYYYTPRTSVPVTIVLKTDILASHIHVNGESRSLGVHVYTYRRTYPKTKGLGEKLIIRVLNYKFKITNGYLRSIYSNTKTTSPGESLPLSDQIIKYHPFHPLLYLASPYSLIKDYLSAQPPPPRVYGRIKVFDGRILLPSGMDKGFIKFRLVAEAKNGGEPIVFCIELEYQLFSTRSISPVYRLTLSYKLVANWP